MGRGREGVASSMVMDRATLGRNVQPLQRDGLIAVETSIRPTRQGVAFGRAGEKRLSALLMEDMALAFLRLFC